MAPKKWIVGALLAAGALTATGCSGNSDDTNKSTVQHGAHAPASTAPAFKAPADTTQACGRINKIDATSYIGSNAQVTYPCEKTTDPNLLGEQVWSDGPVTAPGKLNRIAVQVITNTNHGGLYASLAETAKLSNATAEQKNCTIRIKGSTRRCLNFMASTGLFMVDMGDTTLAIIPSQSGARDASGARLEDIITLESSAQQQKLRKFATDAAGKIYS